MTQRGVRQNEITVAKVEKRDRCQKRKITIERSKNENIVVKSPKMKTNYKKRN